MYNLNVSAVQVNSASDPEVRRGMIGATDITRILGLAPEGWGTAVDVWAEKTGRKEPADLSDVEAVQTGLFLEDGVAKLYQWRTGRSLARANRATFRGKDGPINHISCHPDFLASDRLVEAKVIGITSPMPQERREQWGDEGTDEYPVHYGAQGIYQMECTRVYLADLAALIGGRGLCLFPIRYDQDLGAHLVDTANMFWLDHVLTDIPPEPRTLADCKLLYPKDNGSVVEGTSEHLSLLQTLQAVTDERKSLEESEAKIKAKLQAFMGEHSILEIQGRVAATWKASSSKRVDLDALRAGFPEIVEQVTKEISSRRFLPKKLKEVA